MTVIPKFTDKNAFEIRGVYSGLTAMAPPERGEILTVDPATVLVAAETIEDDQSLNLVENTEGPFFNGSVPRETFEDDDTPLPPAVFFPTSYVSPESTNQSLERFSDIDLGLLVFGGGALVLTGLVALVRG